MQATLEIANSDAEIRRIQAEYRRRAREIPEDFYAAWKPANLFLYTQRARGVLQALKTCGMFPLADKKIVEVGCGCGGWLLDLMSWGANPSRLAGIDIDGERLEAAKKRLGGCDLRHGDASQLPWPEQSFDLCVQSTVFTSILDNHVKSAVAQEMLRVLKPDGLILWYDFRYNNPHNPNVRGIEAAEIRRLFPGCDIRLQKMTLAPPITRRLVRVSWILCLLLEKVPLLRTHYLGVIRKAKGR